MLAYKELVRKVLHGGQNVLRRNSNCWTIPGMTMTYYVGNKFPILTGRKIYVAGVFGELAAMVRGPKNLNDFKKWGCNYWDSFADEDGNLVVDYGNAWLEPVNQIEKVLWQLDNDSNSRRIMINGWRPENIDSLTLPCCHFAYQFVTIGDELHLIWYQRSADIMVGVPSDMVLANLLLIGFANSTIRKYKPGTVTMMFGDAHIYEEHHRQVHEYLGREIHDLPTYKLTHMDITTFNPNMLELVNYKHEGVINFKLFN